MRSKKGYLLIVNLWFFLLTLTSIPSVAQTIFQSPDSDRSEGGRRFVGHRTECESQLPEINTIVKSDYLTTQSHPTLLLKVEHPTALPISVALVDVTTEKKLLHRVITYLDRPGIVAFAIPSTTPRLKRERKYLWYVVFECTSESALNPRIEIPVKKIPVKKTDQPSVKYYLSRQLWWDALVLSYYEGEISFNQTLESIPEEEYDR